MRKQSARTGRDSWATFLVAGLCLVADVAWADLWTTAYYPGFEQAAMPASAIDFSAVSHIIHFALVANTDGSLNSVANSLTPANSADLVTRAHAAGSKVLVCVGGAGNQAGFQGATTPANLALFISNLTNFVAARGYDGVDLDWEPLPVSDAPQYTNLVNGLRLALNGFTQPKILTAAITAYPVYGDPPASEALLFARLQGQFDQLNLMTYDLSGPYDGWVTWFNSPIYDGGYRFPSTGALLPSVDGAVGNFIGNGVSPSKLGIGIAFYGYVWSGGTGTPTGGAALPRQSWSAAPVSSAIRYTTIASTYYQSNLFHWDTNAQAAYLSIDLAGSSGDKFISYDDARTCQSKVSYARNHHLGGVMIWELAQDRQASQPDPLLQAVKQALATPGTAAIQLTNQGIQLSFDSSPLGLYRVLWTSNLNLGTWNTLSSNFSSTGGLLRVQDPSPPAATQRFYRILTPP